MQILQGETINKNFDAIQLSKNKNKQEGSKSNRLLFDQYNKNNLNLIEDKSYHKSSIKNNTNKTSNNNLSLTMVGNVTLSKGMYLTLMKRREQKVFGNTLYSSAPRLKTKQCKIQSSKQYSSCDRLIGQQNSKSNISQHSFKVGKTSKSTTQKQKSQLSKQSENRVLRLDTQKTKIIKKDSCNKSFSETIKRKQSTRSQNQSNRVLKDITSACINKSNQSRNDVKSSIKSNKENIYQDVYQIQNSNNNVRQVSNSYKIDLTKSNQLTFQNKPTTSSMKERSMMKQKINMKMNQSKQYSQTQKQTKQSQIVNQQIMDDKENQINQSNLIQSQQGNNNSKQNSQQCSQESLLKNLWHEEAEDMQTERAMFIQKIKKDKKKKYAQSSKVCVPGYRVKFEASKSKIFAFNCFRDKDLCIEKQFCDTINIEQDNDYDTDSEQLKESIYNVFQSLCVAVCEEKINSQIF